MMKRLIEFIKEGFTLQLALKLLALALATILFYVVRGMISNVISLNLPVEVDVEDGRTAIFNIDPPLVRVTFRGALSDLRQLDERDLAVVVRPFSPEGFGVESIPLRTRYVQGRAGNRVVLIEPSTIRVAFDRQDERDIPVAPPGVLGKPLRGKVEIEYEPRTVRVRGAVRHLEELIREHIRLQPEPVDVEGRVQSFSRRVRILPPEGVWLTAITPNEIQARVNIVTDVLWREYTNVPVHVVGVPDRMAVLRVDPRTVFLRISGSPEVMRRLDPDSVIVFADARMVGEGVQNHVPLRVSLPDNIAVEAVVLDPHSIRIQPLEPLPAPPAEAPSE